MMRNLVMKIAIKFSCFENAIKFDFFAYSSGRTPALAK